MKAHIIYALAVISPIAAIAQSTSAISQAAAKHPDLKIAGSPIHAEFMRLKRIAETSNDPIMNNPNWPVLLADKAAKTQASAKQKQSATLAGFLNIPWGTRKQEAVEMMLSRPGVEKEPATKPTVETFKGGEFAGFPAKFWVLGFDSAERFHTARISIDTRPSELLEKFDSVRDLISEKYGKPDADVKRYAYPYDTDANGHELTAIKLGKATIYAAWKFPVDGKPGNIVTIEVTEFQSIMITYQNGELIKAVVSESKETKKKDL
jgi:hypothetical protein